MSEDVRRRLDEARRLHTSLPSPLRESSVVVGDTVRLIVSRGDEFNMDDLANAARKGLYLFLVPSDNGPALDLNDLTRVLGEFEGIVVNGENPERYLNWRALEDLRRTKHLWIGPRIDERLNLSNNLEIRELGVEGEIALTAFELPNLRKFGFSIDRLPMTSMLTSPVEILSIHVDSGLRDMGFVARPDLVRGLTIRGDNVDWAWFDAFESLVSLEMGFCNLIVIPPEASVLKRPAHFSFEDVQNVVGIEHMTQIPSSGGVTVHINHAFPPSFVELVSDRNWWFDPYLDPVSPLYPFVVEREDSGYAVEFSAWSLAPSYHSMINSMIELARKLSIPVVDDSEADAARVLVSDLDQANKLASALSASWREQAVSEADH